MAKSRKGKVASRRLCIKQLTDTLTKKIESVSCDKRPKLVKMLKEEMAKTLGNEQYQMFSEALSNVPNMSDYEMQIALDNALEKIGGQK